MSYYPIYWVGVYTVKCELSADIQGHRKICNWIWLKQYMETAHKDGQTQYIYIYIKPYWPQDMGRDGVFLKRVTTVFDYCAVFTV